MQTILFVEPDKTIGQTYEKYFSGAGYKVFWAQTSSNALKTIDANSIDLIIAELLIPAHNGLELIYEIRSYADWSNIKIMLNTTVKQSKLSQSPVYKQLNIAKYVYKPDSTLEHLHSAIQAVMTA